jgi:predicted nuclease of predicted toxin-antitoxin system
MRIKLDENLPESLADELAALGHDVDTVPREGLKGRDDPAIRAAAQGEGRFLVTQDLDFSDLRAFEPGTHHGLLLVRLREPTRRGLIERVRSLFEAEDVEPWRSWFVVATEHKVRVRRPPEGPQAG